jgi:RNase P protein component
LGAPWSGRDTIIIARAGIGDEASESVEAALRDTLKRAGVTIT